METLCVLGSRFVIIHERTFICFVRVCDLCTFAIAACLLFAHDYLMTLFGICARYAFVILFAISARLAVWARHSVLVRCIMWAGLYCLCFFVSRFVDWSFVSYVLSFCFFVLIYLLLPIPTSACYMRVFAIGSPAFRRSDSRRQVPVRPQRRERS